MSHSDAGADAPAQLRARRPRAIQPRRLHGPGRLSAGDHWTRADDASVTQTDPGDAAGCEVHVQDAGASGARANRGEHEVAEAVGDHAAAATHHRLEHMRVRAQYHLGTGPERGAGELTLSRG